jgi:hypothetical protein
VLPVEEKIGRAHDDSGRCVEDEPTIRRQRFIDVVLKEVAFVNR